tara:strand:+ start:2736 stop:3059 length:324 start_codon:yes stop_codon:yes gene_type:complete
MNKKADISIVILVLGVVAICILTIFSFVGEKNEREGDFLGIGLIETMNSIEEEFDFFNELGSEFKSEDYKNNVFERKGVNIKNINSEEVIGTYSKKGKTFVKIIYKK